MSSVKQGIIKRGCAKLGAAIRGSVKKAWHYFFNMFGEDLAAAYSLRKLSPSATRSVTIRRDSDNETMDLGFIGEDADISALEAFGRKNFLSYTEQFDNAAWTKTNVTINPNDTTSPIGDLTADLNTCVASIYNYTRQILGVRENTQYTFSYYVKEKDLKGQTPQIRIYDISNATNILQDPISIGSEWTRITQTFTTPAGCSQVFVYSVSVSAGVGGTSEIWTWGAQLELGATATNYQMNTTDARDDILVSDLYDQRGNGYTASQATATAQPKIFDAIDGVIYENLKAAIEFDGVDDYLTTGAFGVTYTQPNTVFMVSRKTDYVTAHYWFDGIGSANRHALLAFHEAYAGASVKPSNSNANQEQVTVLFNTTTSEIRQDGTQTASDNIGTQSLTGLTIGARYGGVETHQGTIQEINLYNANKTTAFEAIEANQKAYYGTP